MATIGERVRQHRERDGLRLRDLAALLGVSETKISRAERNERTFNTFELAVLSDTYGWNIRELLGLQAVRPKMAIAARIRTGDGDGARERAATLVEIDAILDDLDVPDRSNGVQILEATPPPGSPAEATDQGEHLARVVREKYQIRGPITDLLGFAEGTLGIDVAIEPLDEGCDGIVVVADRFALAVIDTRADLVSGRQRFTLAHEIGHVVAGDVSDVLFERRSDAAELAEIRASAFAAELLAPGDDLRRLLGPKPGVVDFVEAMAQFGVSWKALRTRCDRIGIAVSEPIASLTGFEVYARAGRSSDEARLSAALAPRCPARLVRRALDAYAEALIGRAVVGTALGLAGDALDARLAQVPLRFEVPRPASLM